MASIIILRKSSRKKMVHDELKSENQPSTSKHHPLLMIPDHRFNGKGPVPTPQALVSLEMIYPLTLSFLNLVLISLRTCPFFSTESAPVKVLRCFIDETPLLKLPKRSLPDRACFELGRDQYSPSKHLNEIFPLFSRLNTHYPDGSRAN